MGTSKKTGFQTNKQKKLGLFRAFGMRSHNPKIQEKNKHHEIKSL